MPILTAARSAVAGGRSIRLPGLPDFNADDYHYVIEELQGWDDGPTPQPVLVPNGGGVGALASGSWEPLESFYTFIGSIEVDSRDQLYLMRRLLLAAVPAHSEAAIQALDADGDNVQVFARLYDKPEIELHGWAVNFTLPLVAPDPYKYALEPVSGQMGVWTGSDWFRTYTASVRTYTSTAGGWVRTYEQIVPESDYPPAAVLDSTGDQTSRRVTTSITGPLTSGDWFVVNEATGEQIWAEASLTAAQTLVLDSQARTARLNGSPVEHLVFGDFLTLPPGQSSFRLISGTPSDGYAEVEALEAFS